jgi:two-component system, OmpR family, sensor histidine kinase KdpD
MKRVDLVVGLLASVGAVALASAGVAVLHPYVPVLSLGVLYVFAVLPVAIAWGLGFAVAVSVASMLAFNWFFLPPKHTFQLRDGANWLALAVYLVTAVVVSALAARARRRRDDAEQRRAEAHVLADAASDLLRGIQLDAELDRLAELAARVLHVPSARIELGAVAPGDGERALTLAADARAVGTVLVGRDEAPDAAVVARFLPALAALLAVAVDRATLEAEALEAETLRRSDVVKTALLRAVSHDLRSPLTAIVASADALASDELHLDPDDREGLVAAIREEAARLDRVVGNLLDLSRLEAGVIDSHPQLWSADDLVAQALDSLRGERERVIVELDPEAPPVRVDAGQIERVLANLVGNALRFSPPGSPVVVRVEHGSTELRVHVVDRGPGIDAGERGALFQPFHRGAGGGSGLGLAIARGFAEANGGRLWTQEDPVGGHFVLALPAQSQVVPA